MAQRPRTRKDVAVPNVLKPNANSKVHRNRGRGFGSKHFTAKQYISTNTSSRRPTSVSQFRSSPRAARSQDNTPVIDELQLQARVKTQSKDNHVLDEIAKGSSVQRSDRVSCVPAVDKPGENAQLEQYAKRDGASPTNRILQSKEQLPRVDSADKDKTQPGQIQSVSIRAQATDLQSIESKQKGSLEDGTDTTESEQSIIGADDEEKVGRTTSGKDVLPRSENASDAEAESTSSAPAQLKQAVPVMILWCVQCDYFQSGAPRGFIERCVAKYALGSGSAEVHIREGPHRHWGYYTRDGTWRPPDPELHITACFMEADGR